MKKSEIVVGEFYAVALPRNNEYYRNHPTHARVVSTTATRLTDGDSWGRGRQRVPAIQVYAPEFPDRRRVSASGTLEELRTWFVSSSQIIRPWAEQEKINEERAKAEDLRAVREANLERRREALRLALRLPGLSRTQHGTVEVPLEELESLARRIEDLRIKAADAGWRREGGGVREPGIERKAV